MRLAHDRGIAGIVRKYARRKRQSRHRFRVCHADVHLSTAAIIPMGAAVNRGFINGQPTPFVAILLHLEIKVWFVAVAGIPNMRVKTAVFTDIHRFEQIKFMEMEKPIEIAKIWLYQAKIFHKRLPQ